MIYNAINPSPYEIDDIIDGKYLACEIFKILDNDDFDINLKTFVLNSDKFTEFCTTHNRSIPEAIRSLAWGFPHIFDTFFIKKIRKIYQL